MSKNKQVYDQVFKGANPPGEFGRRDFTGSLKDAFWLANKIKLFAQFGDYGNEFRTLQTTKSGQWVIEEMTEVLLECGIECGREYYKSDRVYDSGSTPQEAIVNAIIAIYGAGHEQN